MIHPDEHSSPPTCTERATQPSPNLITPLLIVRHDFSNVIISGDQFTPPVKAIGKFQYNDAIQAFTSHTVYSWLALVREKIKRDSEARQLRHKGFLGTTGATYRNAVGGDRSVILDNENWEEMMEFLKQDAIITVELRVDYVLRQDELPKRGKWRQWCVVM